MRLKTQRTSWDTVTCSGGYLENQQVIDGHLWQSTVVMTPHGFVITHSNHKYNDTTLQFIYEGRKHFRHISQYHRPRYIVTLAKRFVKEIVETYEQPSRRQKPESWKDNLDAVRRIGDGLNNE